MADLRSDPRPVRVYRVAGLVAGAIGALILFYMAGSMLGDPASPIHRYGDGADLPHVFVRGTLRGVPETGLPPLCFVVHERYERCGKSSCWNTHESMFTSQATVDVEWSSSPLPASVTLSGFYLFEPRGPAYRAVDQARAEAWKELAQRPPEDEFAKVPTTSSETDRIREACLDDGEPVFIEACVSPSDAQELEPCPGLPYFGVLRGEPQSAIDDAADSVALRVAGAFLALLVALLAFARGGSPLTEGLEDRAAPHRRRLGAAWALLGVPPAAGLVTFLLTGSPVTSTWATGRLGFAAGVSVLALWLLVALDRHLRRDRTLAALTPVLATRRSLLADASGTVELAVRARQREDGLRAFIGDDVVAFSQLRIVEEYKEGKTLRDRELLVYRQSDELAVKDESGDGVLLLSSAVLDVELRKSRMGTLSSRYAEHGIAVERHPNHTAYLVEERVIHDGEPLYVFGDVSRLALRAGEAGYRSVRGSPTLGGEDHAPVLVYAGDERGLVAMLTTRARDAKSLALLAACACVALAGALAGLAWL